MTVAAEASIAERVMAALALRPAVSRSIVLAGVPIRISVERGFASEFLAPFAHLDRDVIEPSGALYIARATAWPPPSRLPECGIVSAEGERVVHVSADGEAVLDRASGTIHALWRNGGTPKPLQLLLSILLADRGIDLLHGGLISLTGNGILLAGAGGSGKSTVALAAFLDGFDFLGDDCVAVRESGGRFDGFSVFGSTALDREHLRRFPIRAEEEVGGKAVLPLARRFPGRVIASTTIRAILLPRVKMGGDVTLKRASGAEALLALAPTSILKRAVPAAASLACMTRMVRALPAYALDMGPVAGIAQRVRELMKELPS